LKRLEAQACTDDVSIFSALCENDLLLEYIPVHHSSPDNDGEFKPLPSQAFAFALIINIS
jgi:hypothetical protein